MPETACLHIQARDSDPIRVVELPGVSVRIGRASYCEVRLPEPELADEECHLRRRGATWHLIPVAAPGAVTIEGRPLDRPRPLPYGVPLQVGAHSLTLRPVGAAPPEWGSARASHPIEAPIVPRVAAEPLRPGPRPDRAPATAVPPADRQPRPELRAGRDPHEPEQKRWEARWKAAGERLKAGATVAPPPIAPKPVPPSPEPARASTRPSGWQGADLPRPETSRSRKFTRPLEPTTFPPVEPSLTNIPSLKRVERPIPTRAPRVPTVARAQPAPPTVEPPAASVLVEFEPSRPADAVHEAEPAGWVGAAQPTTDLPRPALEDAPAGWVSVAQPTTDLPRPALEADVPIPPSAPEPASRTSEWEEARGAIARKRLRNRGRSSQAGAAPVLGTIRTLGTAIKTPASGRTRSPEAPGRNVAAPPDPDEPPRPGSPTEVDTGPLPPVSMEPSVAALANPVIETGAWHSLQTPFVTDTQRTDFGGWTGPPPALEPPVVPEPEWPSARDILAAHGTRVAPRRETATRDAPRPAPEARRPLPTPGREPAQWDLPGWTVWLPLLALTVFGATAGVSLAWAWGQDDREAGLAANYIAAGLPGAKLPHGSGLVPDTRWTRATGANLARRAVALEFSGAEAEHRDQIETLLRAATLASPLEPTARFALARLGVDRGKPGAAEGQAPARGLGLTRDVVTLTFTARALLKAGKTEAALRTYRSALDLATRAEPSQLALPEYNDDATVRRYALPGEDLVGLATRALIEQTDSSFTEWSPALHDSPVAALVAARALRDRARIDADAALDIVLARTDGDALGLAARAEAHALKAEWSQAETLYRAAIDAMPIDRVRRAWLVNLADIERRLNDDTQRQKALEAAKTIDPNDEITRRVVELQKSSGDRAEPPRGRSTPRVTTTR